ncbi:unnamed protein product [Rhodiola kirilowii]
MLPQSSQSSPSLLQSNQIICFSNLTDAYRFASFSSSPYRNGSTHPETDCPVLFDQQPINEYNNLSTNWASADLLEYCSRLFVTGAAFALFVGVQVAWFGAVGPDSEPVERILAAASSGVLVVTLDVVRMYLGWAYVGNRLLSATVEYEETGWYDGQAPPAPPVISPPLLKSSFLIPVLVVAALFQLAQGSTCPALFASLRLSNRFKQKYLFDLSIFGFSLLSIMLRLG